MRRKGFTLMELMVVVSIVALLVAIVLPSMGPVMALGKATICRGNLRRLSDAFSASSSTKTMQGGDTFGVGDVVGAYPPPLSWPTIPADAVPDPDIYQCPEGDGIVRKPWKEQLKLLEYECPYGRFPLTTTEGLSSFYLARRGEAGNKGPYTDYMLQDDQGNGQLELMDFNGWFDTDGFVRVYDSGEIHIFDHVPDTPEFAGAGGPGYPDKVNTCGDLNAIRYQGKPAFGAEGRVRNHRGKTYKLDDWQVYDADYGINSYAHEYPYGTNCIVLVDYSESVVEVDTPVETEKKLLENARHLGKVNYLLATGQVRTAAPMEVSPRLELAKWRPRRDGVSPR